MLQIISNSNETSTGAELVQNGNFSEVGSNAVQNPDFSEEGANVVLNPNFTDTGAELVSNWDMESGFTLGIANDYTVPLGTPSQETSIYVSSTNSQKISTSTSLAQLKHNNITVSLNGSYKASCWVRSDVSQSIKFLDYNGSGEETTITVVADTWTELIFYITKGNTTFIPQIETLTNQTGYILIDNVSVKELGGDWTLGTGWSIGDTKAICDGTQTSQSNLYQVGIVPINIFYTVTFTTTIDAGTVHLGIGGSNELTPVSVSGTYTFISRATGGDSNLYLAGNSDFIGSVTNITAKEVGQDWTLGTAWGIGDSVAISDGSASNEISQNIPGLLVGVAYRITFDINSFTSGTGFQVKMGSTTPYSISYNTTGTKSLCQLVAAGSSTNLYFLAEGLAEGSITNISVQTLDPNGYWGLGLGWCIGVDKAESDGTVNDSDINQQGALTDPVGKTYQTTYKIEDFVSGSIKATIGSVDFGAVRTADGTYTDIITVTSAPLNLIGYIGGSTSFDGSITDISAKLVGSYSDQSIYVTAADVQTIAQASVYYLVELTSMGSKNSLYFLPSSVVANNGRYTKLNFTVVSKDALPQPGVGIISFYDSVGGFDTYPMGFYEFKIYEQTSSTNLDPLLATGLLEKGFAFVRDFSGNMQELTSPFNEYDPTLTQYVYSK